MSQTLPLFDLPDTAPPLIERITAYRPHIEAKDVPASADKWELASNLQKAIRRGLTETAVGTATKLLSVDERYFWRRLTVIAYEDVGFGDIPLCHDLLKTFRREALHRQIGSEHVGAYFVDALSNARKSRALCDAIAMVEFNVRRGEIEKPFFAMTDKQLVDVICSENESLMERVAALRHICGYRENAHGSYRAITPARQELMREVCRALKLTEMETTLFLSGQSVSESLNIALPLVAQLARGEQREMQAEQIVFEGKNGILYAALDRHTRAGKKCLAKFAQEVKPIANFFQHHPNLNPVAALGVAVFIVEGSQLNRWVVFPQSDILRQTFEQNFLEHAGVIGGSADELLASVRSNLTELNRIRAKHIKIAAPIQELLETTSYDKTVDWKAIDMSDDGD